MKKKILVVLLLFVGTSFAADMQEESAELPLGYFIKRCDDGQIKLSACYPCFSAAYMSAPEGSGAQKSSFEKILDSAGKEYDIPREETWVNATQCMCKDKDGDTSRIYIQNCTIEDCLPRDKATIRPVICGLPMFLVTGFLIHRNPTQARPLEIQSLANRKTMSGGKAQDIQLLMVDDKEYPLSPVGTLWIEGGKCVVMGYTDATTFDLKTAEPRQFKKQFIASSDQDFKKRYCSCEYLEESNNQKCADKPLKERDCLLRLVAASK